MEPLISERLFLRGMQNEEWHAFWRGFQPDAIAHPEPYAYHEARCEKMFEHTVERATWYPTFGIFLKGTGEPIGTIQLKRIIPKKHQCEFGIMLRDDSVKGKGYGSEAAATIFPFAFSHYGLKRIYADTFGTNKRMQHLLPKWGFRYISTYRRHFKTSRGRIDRMNYVLVQKWYHMRLRDYRLFAFLPAAVLNLRQWAYLQRAAVRQHKADEIQKKG
ncbi:MAG: GNAT family N-acetyltransferase [Clostridiales bacterium]|nr:GNAT family N-acetyltransferase [Clostridiales bacterium]